MEHNTDISHVNVFTTYNRPSTTEQMTTIQTNYLVGLSHRKHIYKQAVSVSAMSCKIALNSASTASLFSIWVTL